MHPARTRRIDLHQFNRRFSYHPPPSGRRITARGSTFLCAIAIFIVLFQVEAGLGQQGGETCVTAYAITSLPFCGGGTMGATTDCNPTTYPYRDLFYSFTPTVTGTYRASLCGSIGDTYMKVWATTCCSGSPMTTADDECDGLDAAKDLTLTAGTTYFFEIGYYGSAQPADAYFFNLFGPEPTGVPSNDLCTGAIPLAIPSTTLGTNRNATGDAGLPTCDGSSVYNWGVWYTVVGNGHNLTARTYNNCSSFDTRIRVLTASSCSGPFTCVGGNNNFGTGSSLSQYTWCSDMGVTYYVIISNNSTTTGRNGPFTLEILDGTVCACDQMPLCGTPTETEPNNICPSQVDPFVIDCAETVYALHCPEADVDYFQIVVPPMTVMDLYHYDGQNCDVNPTTSIRSRVYDASCVLLAGPTDVGWRLTNSGATPWNLYIEIYASASTSRLPYKLVATCCDIVDYCANPIVLPPVYSYTNTVNTCCATNPVSDVFEYICGAAPYTSGNDAFYRFTITSTANLTVTATGACDNQVMIMQVCGDTSTCVATKDSTFSGEPEVIVTTLPAGTYYVSTSCYNTDCDNITLVINSDVPLNTNLSVSVGDSTFTFGVNALNTWLTPQTSVITNDGNVAENFVARISQFTTGSNTWNLDSTANGADTVRAQWSTTSATGPWTDITAYDSDFTIATNVAASDSVTLWFRIETPTTTSSYNQYSSSLTVTAVQY